MSGYTDQIAEEFKRRLNAKREAILKPYLDKYEFLDCEATEEKEVYSFDGVKIVTIEFDFTPSSPRYIEFKMLVY